MIVPVRLSSPTRSRPIFDAGKLPNLDRVHDRFKPDPASILDVAVRLTPLSAYDELVAVCQPKAEFVLEGAWHEDPRPC
jgi:hypothetical protein